MDVGCCGWAVGVAGQEGTSLKSKYYVLIPIYYFHNLLLMSYHEIRDKSNTLKNDPYVQLKS